MFLFEDWLFLGSDNFGAYSSDFDTACVSLTGLLFLFLLSAGLSS